jgi:general secretion pathway protein G
MHTPPIADEPDRRDPQSGFTLLEILVVIAILGLLIGLVAPAALRQLGGARLSVARQSIERLGSVLDLYRLDVGSYPNSQDGLTALISRPSDAPNWSGPYVQNGQLPMDPWSHPYIYREPSTRPGHSYDLCSRGPNATAGEAGTESLICNP